jgi:hypothetical protein
MAEERDFIMARLCAASAHARATAEAIEACADLFVYPSEDKSGKDRKEALDSASASAGEVSRSVEMAQEILESLDKEQLNEEEPEDDDEEDDGTGENSSSEE